MCMSGASQETTDEFRTVNRLLFMPVYKSSRARKHYKMTEVDESLVYGRVSRNAVDSFRVVYFSGGPAMTFLINSAKNKII